MIFISIEYLPGSGDDRDIKDILLHYSSLGYCSRLQSPWCWWMTIIPSAHLVLLTQQLLLVSLHQLQPGYMSSFKSSIAHRPCCLSHHLAIRDCTISYMKLLEQATGGYSGKNVFKDIAGRFGIYSMLVHSLAELDEKINITPLSVHWIHNELAYLSIKTGNMWKQLAWHSPVVINSAYQQL